MNSLQEQSEKTKQEKPPTAESSLSISTFSEKVRQILLAQPLNPLKKVEFTLLPRRAVNE